MKKKLTLPKLIKKLVIVFSRFIRIRDADRSGMVRCITCDTLYLWKDVHAGHFVKSGRRITKFVEENVNGQCVSCNSFNEGEQYKHGKAIDLKFGTGTADRLIKDSVKEKKFKRYELEEMIKNYTEEYKMIAKVKGIEII